MAYPVGQVIIAILPSTLQVVNVPGVDNLYSLVVAKIVRVVTTTDFSGEKTVYDLFVPSSSYTYEDLQQMDAVSTNHSSRLFRSLPENCAYTKYSDAVAKLHDLVQESSLFSTYFAEVPQV